MKGLTKGGDCTPPFLLRRELSVEVARQEILLVVLDPFTHTNPTRERGLTVTRASLTRRIRVESIASHWIGVMRWTGRTSELGCGLAAV